VQDASNAGLDGDVSSVWDPDAAQVELVARINAKQEIAELLIRGETTLSAAAARFRELSGGDSASLTNLRALYPHASDEELWYRQVIGFVRSNTRMNPARVAALVPKLEAEIVSRFPPRTIGSPQPQNVRRNAGVPQAAQIRVSDSPHGPRGSRARPR
jgi:hypothetical protein